MLILWAGETVVVAVLVIGFTTQIIIPLWKGSTLFPLLRQRRRDALVEELAEARREITALRRQLYEIEVEGAPPSTVRHAAHNRSTEEEPHVP